jgi:hypothetical protein
MARQRAIEQPPFPRGFHEGLEYPSVECESLFFDQILTL